MKKVISIVFAVMLLALSVVPAFAVESPVAPTYKYNVTINPSEGGNGSYEFTTEIDENGKQGVHLTAITNSGYTFDNWSIEGAYSTEGNLTDSELDIVISGDITATPIFTKNSDSDISSGSDTTVATIKTDNSSTSPKTGSNDIIPYAVVLLSVVACGFAAFKLVKSK